MLYDFKKMYDKAVSTYSSAINFVPEGFLIQQICDKAVNKCFSAFDSISDWCKSQEMRDRVVSEDPFLIVYCPAKYITQKLCDQAVDDSLATLND